MPRPAVPESMGAEIFPVDADCTNVEGLTKCPPYHAIWHMWFVRNKRAYYSMDELQHEMHVTQNRKEKMTIPFDWK